jgi:hypothetical protein
MIGSAMTTRIGVEMLGQSNKKEIKMSEEDIREFERLMIDSCLLVIALTILVLFPW